MQLTASSCNTRAVTTHETAGVSAQAADSDACRHDFCPNKGTVAKELPARQDSARPHPTTTGQRGDPGSADLSDGNPFTGAVLHIGFDGAEPDRVRVPLLSRREHREHGG